MCVIYACASKLPPKDELERGAACNKDGAGISWVKDRKVYWQKGLESDTDETLKFIKDNKIPFPISIHYRAASIGGTDEELTHPFPVSPKAETMLAGSHGMVLFQNGTWRDWEETLLKVVLTNTGVTMPSGPWNDARALAFLASHKGTDILAFLGGDSRLLAMTANKKTPFWFWGKWLEKEGWWQSIETYTQIHRLPSKHSSHRYSPPGRKSDDSDVIDITPYRRLAANAASATSSGDDEPDDAQLQEWTPEELQTLVNRAKEEIANARRNCSLFS